MKKVVFVFSGGGMKIGWHLGVVKAAYQKGYSPHAMIGTSAGALIAGALNYNSVQEVEDLLMSLKKKSDVFKLDWKQKFKIMLRRANGIYSLEPLEKLINKYIQGNSKFLSIAVTTNMRQGFNIFFKSTQSDYKEAVLASSAIPGIMEIPKMGIFYQADGGIRTQIAYEFTKEYFPEYEIIVIGTSPFSRDQPIWDNHCPKEYQTAFRAIDVMSNEIYYTDMCKCYDRGDIKMVFPDESLNTDTMEVDPVKMRANIDKGYAKGMEVL